MTENKVFDRRRFIAGASGVVTALKPLSLIKLLSMAMTAEAQSCVELVDVDGQLRIDLPTLRDRLLVGASRGDVQLGLAEASIPFEEPTDPSRGELGGRLQATSDSFSIDVLFDSQDHVTSYLLRGDGICFNGVRVGFALGTLTQRFPRYEILAGPDFGPPFFVTELGVSFELKSPDDWEDRLASGEPPQAIVTDGLTVTGLVVWR